MKIELKEKVVQIESVNVETSNLNFNLVKGDISDMSVSLGRIYENDRDELTLVFKNKDFGNVQLVLSAWTLGHSANINKVVDAVHKLFEGEINSATRN